MPDSALTCGLTRASAIFLTMYRRKGFDMQNPEFDVRRISTASEDKLFLDLAEPFLRDNKDCISSYRLKYVIQCGGDAAYAIYEEDHSILPVRFCLGEESLVFGNDESAQLMPIDEIRLMRELGEVVIDGVNYYIENTRLHIADEAGKCQHMIVFDLKNKC